MLRKFWLPLMTLASLTTSSFAANLSDKAPVAAGAYNWTGFYVGGSVGGRWTTSNLSIGSIDELYSNNTFTQHDLPSCTKDMIPCRTSASLRGNTLSVGPYVGYDWQFGERWVAGVEGDWAWANNTATADGFKFFIGNPPADSTFSVKTGWDASARGRLGYLAIPNLLIYATGGAAWLNTEVTSNCGATSCFPGTYSPNVVSQSSIRSGWTVGGGIESMLGANWILRAEYRYADYGTASLTDTRPCTSQPGCNAASSLNVGYNHELKSQTVMLGVAYKFDRP
jgi:outer membrane immunogenic protein